MESACSDINDKIGELNNILYEIKTASEELLDVIKTVSETMYNMEEKTHEPIVDIFGPNNFHTMSNDERESVSSELEKKISENKTSQDELEDWIKSWIIFFSHTSYIYEILSKKDLLNNVSPETKELLQERHEQAQMFVKVVGELKNGSDLNKVEQFLANIKDQKAKKLVVRSALYEIYGKKVLLNIKDMKDLKIFSEATNIPIKFIFNYL